MRRDMDLIRELLFRIEQMDLPPGVNAAFHGFEPEVTVEGHDPDAINLHLRMLLDAGLIDGRESGRAVQLTGLTWSGHDFLSSVRDDTVWRRTKDGAARAGGFSFGLLRDLATAILKGELAKHTEIPMQ